MNKHHFTDSRINGQDDDIDRKIEDILMSARPEPEYDAEFEATLRQRILSEYAARARGSRRRFSFPYAATPLLRIAAFGALAVAIAAVATTIIMLPGQRSGTLALRSPSSPSITKLGNNAFGPLQVMPKNTISGGSASPSPLSMNAAAVSAAPINMGTVNTGASGAAGTSSNGGSAMKPILRPVVLSQHITYTYAGAPIHQDKEMLTVLKTIPVALTHKNAGTIFGALGLGSAFTSAVHNAQLTDLTVSEQKSFGYTIAVNVAQGTFSVYQNYNEWPNSSNTIGSSTPTMAADAISTSSVIGIANTFLAHYGIGTSSYAAPQLEGTLPAVSNAAAASVGASTASTTSATPVTPGRATGSTTTRITRNGTTNMPMIPYRPDSIQVLYPRMVNGMKVYNGSQPVGIQVTVNLQYGRVESMYGWQNVRYASSKYHAVTSTQEIIARAEQEAGITVIYHSPSFTGAPVARTLNGSTQKNLGTPTMVYKVMHHTAQNGGASMELLVPAYAFPIMGGPGSGTSRMVVVPLIQNGVTSTQPAVMM